MTRSSHVECFHCGSKNVDPVDVKGGIYYCGDCDKYFEDELYVIKNTFRKRRWDDDD